MPVYCTQCGTELRQGQRFCDQCGAPVPSSELREENKPRLDLSDYFDDRSSAARRTPAENGQQPRPVPKAAVYPPRQSSQQSRRPTQAASAKAVPKAENTRSDRGLNIALLVLGTLAIAVLTFTIILLLWPKNDPAPAAPASSPVPIVTPAPAGTADAGQQSPVETPAVQIVTPTPLPSAPVVITPSPSPSPTPAPTPASEYLLPESNSRYLTAADLSGLSHEQLCFARNEIFARHGRIFKTPEIAAYFSGKTWYKGTVSPQMFSEKVFNQYESYNVGFIRDYENKYYGGSYY